MDPSSLRDPSQPVSQDLSIQLPHKTLQRHPSIVGQVPPETLSIPLSTPWGPTLPPLLHWIMNQSMLQIPPLLLSKNHLRSHHHPLPYPLWDCLYMYNLMRYKMWYAGQLIPSPLLPPPFTLFWLHTPLSHPLLLTPLHLAYSFPALALPPHGPLLTR